MYCEYIPQSPNHFNNGNEKKIIKYNLLNWQGVTGYLGEQRLHSVSGIKSELYYLGCYSRKRWAIFNVFLFHVLLSCLERWSMQIFFCKHLIKAKCIFVIKTFSLSNGVIWIKELSLFKTNHTRPSSNLNSIMNRWQDLKMILLSFIYFRKNNWQKISSWNQQSC